MIYFPVLMNCTDNLLTPQNSNKITTRSFINFFQLSVILTIGLSMLLIPGAHGQWKNLIGDDLSDWKQLGGKASYNLDDGVITGSTVMNSPNSFLTTRERFGDFILEFEVLVDPSLNSGVQIRSNSNKDYQDGAVHGYQVELDPSARAFSGGIYDERRRQWLYPLARNPKGRKAFLNGVWNKVRVQAIGNSMETWINNIQCANLIDDMTAEGFIGLQVHSISDAAQEGKTVRWRNLKIATKNLNDLKWQTDPDVAEFSYLLNTLTDNEIRKGWRLLWDGQSSQGWRGARLDDFPSSGWEMENGILTITGTEGGEAEGPGDIVTVDRFSNFELELQFKITDGANSGIKYFVDPDLNKGPGSAIGCEFQILDDKKHPDAKMGVNGNRTLGSLYDLIPAENLSTSGRSKPFKGIGTWNTATIISRDGKVEHWLNHEKVVEYDRFTPMFRALVAYSKYKDWNQFGQWPEGNILLQDHGNTVHFRNIKIREF